MNELALISRLRQKRPARSPGVVTGIGDDAAVLRPRAGEDLLFTTDMMVEDVHFERGKEKPEDTGYRTLARGLSDIAAMGGTPRFSLLSIALAPWTKTAWLDRFFDGFLELAGSAAAPLVGGDISHSAHFAADVVVGGGVARGGGLRRSTARPGDAIFVSGTLGGAALGRETRKGAAWQRHLRPSPRLKLGRYLSSRATAAMDLSDGLSLDLHRLCLESGVGAVIDRPLPVFPGASLDHALHGGEDYELLFTAKPSEKIGGSIAGLPVTRIGTIAATAAGAVDFFGSPLPPRGYDHLRGRG